MYKIIGADQKEYGPISAEQLRLWISEGRLNAHSKIQAEGSGEWKTLSQFPEWAAVLPPGIQPGIMIPPPLTRRNNGLAVASLVLGILAVPPCCSVILGPVGIVLGAMALSQIKRHPEQKGKELAIIGMVLSVLGLIIYCFAAVLLMANGGPGQLRQLLHN